MKIETVFASSVAKLDSNVKSGGGTDLTTKLQEILDRAKDGDGIRLIMDGAALVSQLFVYSNTIIECLTKDCGFYQIAQSNCAIITNANWSTKNLSTRNITLVGGTYNQNCKNQKHDISWPENWYKCPAPGERKNVVTLEFYGVENITVRDMTICDFRTYAFLVGAFKNVLIENVWLDLPNYMPYQNQDGFHFWGPGQFLTVKNVGGRVADDFMNIGPDEIDKISSITDVLIDGVFLDDADQGIRLLSRGKGRLDRITIRNVTGTYTSYGFYINPWYREESYGNYGNIFIENIDMRQIRATYDYRPAVLFCIGGNIECITFKNIRHHNPSDNRSLFDFGLPFSDLNNEWETFKKRPRLQTLIIDGLTIIEDKPKDTSYIQIFDKIENLILKNVILIRDGGENASGYLISMKEHGYISSAILSYIQTRGLNEIIFGTDKIESLITDNIKLQ
jgi:hypothetical protein